MTVHLRRDLTQWHWLLMNMHLEHDTTMYANNKEIECLNYRPRYLYHMDLHIPIENASNGEKILECLYRKMFHRNRKYLKALVNIPCHFGRQSFKEELRCFDLASLDEVTSSTNLI